MATMKSRCNPVAGNYQQSKLVETFTVHQTDELSLLMTEALMM